MTSQELPASPSLQVPFSFKIPTLLDDAALVWLCTNNTGLQFEQTSEGELIVSPPTGNLGNRAEGMLFSQFVVWNARTRFGEVRGLTGGVHLPRGGDYAPDVYVLTRAEWDAVPDDRVNDLYLPALPIAVVELLSRSNLTTAGYTPTFEKKLKDYALSAVPLVLLLNPNLEKAIVRRPGQDEVTLTQQLLTFPELPGLELDVASVYTAAKKR
jgi:Uma2 family endonuclease